MKKFTIENISFGFLFLLTITLTLFPFFNIGFTTADDLEYYMTARVGDFWSNAKMYAESAGRFYFLITKPLYHIPYIIDNFYFTKSIQYSFLLLSFALFTYLVFRITKSKAVASMNALLLFVCLIIMPNEVAIIAYPFFFTCSFSIFLLSILSYVKYKENSNIWHLLLSVVLYAIALLFYENYLVFLMFFLAFVFYKNLDKEKIFRTFTKKSLHKEFIPYICVAFIYLIVYFVYRKCLPQDSLYGGSSFASNFSIKHFFDVLWNYNRAAFPTQMYYFYQDVIAQNSDLLRGHIDSIFYILKHCPIRVITNSAIQCFLFVFILRKTKNELTWRHIIIGLVACGLFALSSHSLLALSEKYNMIYFTKRGYVTTYFSYFSTILFFVICIVALQKLVYSYKYLSLFVSLALTMMIGYIAIITNYTNEYVSKDWAKGNARFDAMEELIKDGAFNNITKDDIIYAGNLYQTISLNRAVYAQGFNWSSFINVKTDNKKVSIIKDVNRFNKLQTLKDSLSNSYYFSCKEFERSEQLLFSLSQLSGIQMLDTNQVNQFVICDKSDVYFYSPLKKYHFVFQSNKDGFIIKDNYDTLNVSKGLNVIEIQNDNINSKITYFHLEGESLIPESFSIVSM